MLDVDAYTYQGGVFVPGDHDLMHFGIKGQRWGQRRFQYKDGSLTPEGRLRYRADQIKTSLDKATKSISKTYKSKKIDTLDYLNRKGVLDFLDSQADKPFKAIRETESRKLFNMDADIKRLSRYSSMVAGMRAIDKNRGVADTMAKIIEDRVSYKVGRRFAEAVLDGKAGSGNSYDDYRDFNYDRPDLVDHKVAGTSPNTGTDYRSLFKLTANDQDKIVREAKIRRVADAVNRAAWDRPMDISTPARDGVDRIVDRFNRIPTQEVSRSYRSVPDNLSEFEPYYNKVMSEWIYPRGDRSFVDIRPAL